MPPAPSGIPEIVTNGGAGHTKARRFVFFRAIRVRFQGSLLKHIDLEHRLAPMASPARSARGFTRMELVVVLAVIVVLVSLAVPAVTDSGGVPGLPIKLLNNARQIHLATMVMVEDSETNKDTTIGWPGDLKAKGHITNLADFVNVLVRNDYLKPNDLKVFSAAGCARYPDNGTLSSGSNGVLVPAFTEEYSAFKVYLVKKDDPANTVFLASKNYTYNTKLNTPSAKPLGDKYFVVYCKGGDGSYHKKSQAQSLQIIGKLPGGGTVESAENCLNPGPTASQQK